MAANLHAEDLRLAACRLARLGADEARRYFGRVVISRKGDDTPVTEADHAAQGAILDVLADEHPTHAVVTEEFVARPERHAACAAAEYCWVIDPIDGTRNFGRGVNIWSTSVGVLRDGRPVAGAVHDATAGRTYSAAAGAGAFCDDQRMVLGDRALDSDTTVAFSSFRRRPIPPVVRGWMDHYLARNFGSLCLHLAWVSAGLVDAAYALEAKLWDLAAGSLLIEEAGGVITDHQGGAVWPVDVAHYAAEDVPILAGTKLMHARLIPDLRADQATA
jgi:myo-inositol-1(or 4)-monophosphatase